MRITPAAADLPLAEEAVIETSDGEKVIVWHAPPQDDKPVVIWSWSGIRIRRADSSLWCRRELLRLVYRLIFLLVAEDRNLLHPPGASASARKLYAEGYSLGSLRARAVQLRRASAQ